MVGVYATNRTEIMLCRHGVELIQGQFVSSLSHLETVKGYRRSNGASFSTDGAVASSRIVYAVGQRQLDLDGPTMAGKQAFRLVFNQRFVNVLSLESKHDAGKCLELG